MRLRTPEWLADAPGSIFAGIPPDELEALMQRLRRRRFAPGEVIVREGDKQAVMYVAQQGSAEAVCADRYGRERIVGHIEAGTTFGEMALLTGEPAAATVRATAELEVLEVAREEFERVAARFPEVYRNLAEILADRLSTTNRLATEQTLGRITILEDNGSPPLLAYALACSVAWHTRTRTLLLVLGQEFPDELERLAATGGEEVLAEGGRLKEPGVDLALVRPEGPFGAERFAGTANELTERYHHVLVLARGDLALPARRRVALGDRTTGAGAAGNGVPPVDLTVRAWSNVQGKRVGQRGGVLEIPPLRSEDERALGEGLLPPSTPAGRALGWLARDLAGLKVGVALGAGSVRGYAHFGVLHVLERLGVTPDYLAGTSIGAAVAASSALGFSSKEGVAVFNRASGIFMPAVPVYSMLSSRGVRRFVHSMTADRKIEDLDVPLGVVTADLLSRREVVLRRGALWQAVLASMAIPGIYPAQRIGPWVLVDGGIIDPVPSSVCVGMGADVVISVSLGKHPEAPLSEAEAIPPPMRPPGALGVILRSIEIMQGEVEADPVGASSVKISPEIAPLPRGALRHFSAGARFFDDGAKAAEEAVTRLAAVLPWLRAGGA
jgi:NTE family protein